MRTRCLLLALLAATLLASSGCMTMLFPPRQEVFVTTDPPGATVRVGYANTMFRAPAMVALDSRYDWTLDASAPGYLGATTFAESHYSPGKIVGSVLLNAAAWGWWTFGIGAAIGIAVDFGSGSLKELDPSRVDVYLERAPSGAAAPPPRAASRAPPARPPRASVCPGCGLKLAGDEAYCPACGRKLD